MKNTPARLWIIPAKEASVALVIRRRPHEVWHFLRWDTFQGTVTSGDWRWGSFYPKDCDVSWDGRLWVYNGGDGEVGSGIALIASLDPLATWYSHGAWGGGGIFDSPSRLRYSLPDWDRSRPQVVNPSAMDVRLAHESASNASPVLSLREQRDGWQSDGMWREGGLVRWQQPSLAHPRLVGTERRTQDHGDIFEFSLPDHPKLLGPGVFRATYDPWGDLLVARRGVLERYNLGDIGRGIPSFTCDLNEIPDAPSPESLKRHNRALWASEHE